MSSHNDPVLDAPLPYGPTLLLEEAKRMMQAAEQYAQTMKWPVSIVITDASGGILMAQKLDNTQHSSMEIAMGKARTAVNFRRPTRMFGQAGRVCAFWRSPVSRLWRGDSPWCAMVKSSAASVYRASCLHKTPKWHRPVWPR